MNVIEVLDRSGHLSLTWDPSIAESVERARAEFEQLRAAGYQFFRVIHDQATQFSPVEGALVVKRVEADDIAPTLRPEPESTPVPPVRTKRGPKPKQSQQGERVVAMRPMRGG